MRNLSNVEMSLCIAESREDRFRRSTLLRADTSQSIPPEIKIAEVQSEWEAAFQLLYDEYLAAGYVTEAISSKMLLGIHHFLPKTVVFIAKISETLTSSLTQFFDDRIFGLPMDTIYKEELDRLRSEGRVVSEIGGVATRRNYRWQNLFMYLCQVMYWYSRHKDVDDLCIAVNPKHVHFYKSIFLFEEFGPQKFYPKVHAPAVLMRLDLTHYEKKLGDTYEDFKNGFNTNDFLHKMDSQNITDFSIPLKRKNNIDCGKIPRMDSAIVNYFLSQNKWMSRGLAPKHLTYLKAIYPHIRLLFPIQTQP